MPLQFTCPACGKVFMAPPSRAKRGAPTCSRLCGFKHGKKVIRYDAGQRFGRLTILREDPERTPSNKARWICRCDCGVIKSVIGSQLRNGGTVSCGCWSREQATKRVTTHGLSKTVEHATWCRLRGRCLNPSSPDYPDYGGRGITVCERWASFENFLADMGPRPSSQHSIDRVNNDGPYSPENCRWTIAAQQRRNNRNVVPITYNGRTMTLNEWATETGISRATLVSRFERDWTPERALTTHRPRGHHD